LAREDILYCSAVWPTHIFYYRPQSSWWRQLPFRTRDVTIYYIAKWYCLL